MADAYITYGRPGDRIFFLGYMLSEIYPRRMAGSLTSFFLLASILKTVLAGEIHGKPHADVYLVLSGDGYSSAELSSLAEGLIRERLQMLSGVKGVVLLGGRRPVLRIHFDSQRLAAYGMRAVEVDAVLTEHGFKMSPVEIGGLRREQVLAWNKDPPPLNELGDIVMKTFKGVPIRLKDLAVLEIGAESEGLVVRYGDKRAVALGVIRAPQFYAAGFCLILVKFLSEIHQVLPQGVQLGLASRDRLSFDPALSP